MLDGRMIYVPVDRWCVYAHYVEGKLIYVGMGQPYRPFSPYKRSKKWLQLANKSFCVSIISWHLTRIEAEQTEKLLIRKLNPVCNLTHTGKAHPSIYGNTWNIGRKHSAESKKIMSERQKESWKKTKRTTGTRRPISPIKCVETGIIYYGLREASRQTGFCPSMISSCINGRKKHVGGYHFTREM